MQIAHIINQLMQHNSDIKQIIKKSGSLVNFYLELWEVYAFGNIQKKFIKFAPT